MRIVVAVVVDAVGVVEKMTVAAVAVDVEVNVKKMIQEVERNRTSWLKIAVVVVVVVEVASASDVGSLLVQLYPSRSSVLHPRAALNALSPSSPAPD